jgi:tRNA(fMet)-specific endonuclease VapC
MADAWATITVGRRRIGKPIGCGDCWIAAAAIRHDLTLVTHNAGDYADLPNLKLVTHAEKGRNR